MSEAWANRDLQPFYSMLNAGIHPSRYITLNGRMHIVSGWAYAEARLPSPETREEWLGRLERSIAWALFEDAEMARINTMVRPPVIFDSIRPGDLDPAVRIPGCDPGSGGFDSPRPPQKYP